MSPPRTHKLLFWLTLAAYSTFFAEVFAGSDMFPFFHTWGIFVVVPLYGLHVLVLLTLIYRFGGRPRLSSLIFAGLLLGLYEAYMTKMLWQPDWGAIITLGNVAVVEISVLVFWWHTWLSFITPVALAEGLLTESRDVLTAFPLRLRRFYGSSKGWLAIALFGAVFQSINSPDPGISLLSGLGTVSVLTLLTALWMRVTHGTRYTLKDLLPEKQGLAIMALWLGGLYIFLGFGIYPERIPAFWPGQAIILGFYALVIALLVRSLRISRGMPTPKVERLPSFPTPKALLGIGAVFVPALPLAKWLLGNSVVMLVTIGWLLGGLFGVTSAVWAVRKVSWKQGEDAPAIAQRGEA